MPGEGGWGGGTQSCLHLQAHTLSLKVLAPCHVCTSASPVLPEVGSMMVSPGFSWPAFSAASTIRRPILSLTDPPALKNSHLATEEEGG